MNALHFFGSTALHTAAFYGSLDVVTLLLEEPRFTRVAHQNFRHQATALHMAAERVHADATRQLLVATRFPSSAVNAVDKEGNSALHWAAWLGHHEVVEELLKSDRFMSVNSSNNFGGTPLGSFQGSKPCT